MLLLHEGKPKTLMMLHLLFIVDTTTLFIKISYKNDNSPVFTSGSSYTVSLGTDTPVGYHVVSVSILNLNPQRQYMKQTTRMIIAQYLLVVLDIQSVLVQTYCCLSCCFSKLLLVLLVIQSVLEQLHLCRLSSYIINFTRFVE